MVRYRQTDRAVNASRDKEQLILRKNSDSDCFGISYDINDLEYCNKCSISNACKQKYIELQKEKRLYRELL